MMWKLQNCELLKDEGEDPCGRTLKLTFARPTAHPGVTNEDGAHLYMRLGYNSGCIKEALREFADSLPVDEEEKAT